ncbi:MAG: RNase J family beta-CASP ribonuclease [Oscillospiraceae bacterium]|nr:RNase J family beta-CASP ribonuclease [Oscillospiraceae bacterium]
MPRQNENKPAEEHEKKRRGRPPKKKAAAESAAQTGQQPAQTAQAAQPAQPPREQKRRGRPPKKTQKPVEQSQPNTAKQAQPNQAKPAGPMPNKAAGPNQEAAAPKNQGRKRGPGRPKRKPPSVRITHLGGLGEVGKNLTVIESAGESFLIDCGLTFPDESMPGVDLVIPDFAYVLQIQDTVKGVFITHGHEDHIGALPYLLKQVKLPVYGSKLTIGLIENKLKEHGLLGRITLNVVSPGDVIQLGQNSIEYIGVNHSIPDACAIACHTPAGTLIHTGDFKIDFTPIDGGIINLARFGELGSKGVLALMSDSTNSEREGSTQSERTVGENLDKIFALYPDKRILVATFSSNVHRVQQIVDAASKYGRKIAVQGRSMANVVAKALELGYLNIPSGILIDIDAAGKYPHDKVVIITTGSQGEPMSALTRMAMGDHRKVTVGPSDCIIISASPIPGNEKLVTKVVNELLKSGAKVVYEKMFDIHVSGHACKHEQKTIIALTKPKFFMPVHGEYKHLKHHAETAVSMGIDPSRVLITDIGKVVEINEDGIGVVDTVQAGKVLVDGLGVGDVGSVVLRDRKHLAQDGLIVVVTTVNGDTGEILSGPDIVSRGFVYVRESEDMIGRARTIARDSIERCMKGKAREWNFLKQQVKDDLGDYFWQMTKRSPMILPVIQEVD